MNEIQTACPDWQVSQWFNTPNPLAPNQLRGEVILLHFFQMLCPGCVAHALPQAQSVHQAYSDSGIRVVGIHSVFEHHEAMTPVALAAFIHEYRLTFPIGVDQAVPGDPIPLTMRRYQLRGTPSTVLIDRTGQIRKHVFGRIEDLNLGIALGQLLTKNHSSLKRSETGRKHLRNPAECDDTACPTDSA